MSALSVSLLLIQWKPASEPVSNSHTEGAAEKPADCKQLAKGALKIVQLKAYILFFNTICILRPFNPCKLKGCFLTNCAPNVSTVSLDHLSVVGSHDVLRRQ